MGSASNLSIVIFFYSKQFFKGATVKSMYDIMPKFLLISFKKTKNKLKHYWNCRIRKIPEPLIQSATPFLEGADWIKT